MSARDAIDTNESRRRHRSAISFGQWLDRDRAKLRLGYVYACPRCSFTSRTCMALVGAELAADRHALECPCDAAGASALVLAARRFEL